MCAFPVVLRLVGHRGDLEADDPGDVVLPGRGDDDLVVEVPHEAWEVGHVHVLHGVVVVVLGAVHPERQPPRPGAAPLVLLAAPGRLVHAPADRPVGPVYI